MRIAVLPEKKKCAVRQIFQEGVIRSGNFFPKSAKGRECCCQRQETAAREGCHRISRRPAHSANGPILAYITHMWAADSNSGSSSDELIHGEGGRRPLLRFAAILIACVTTTMMQAQESPHASRSASVRVHGQATISVEPNQAQFDIGVVSQATTAKAATDQNKRQSDALIHELNAAFPSATINGVNFSVNPNYQYPKEGAPTIAGYTASNTVRLLLNDISKLQTVVDIAVKSGATSINRLTFTVRNEDSARAQALAAAAHQAQAGAVALATSLQLRIVRLLTVEEGQPVIVSPPREISFEKLQSTNLAPISPGTIDVHADVDLTYEAVPAAEQPTEKAPTTPRSPAKK